MYVKGKLVLVYFKIVLILVQDRCMVCAEHPIVLQRNIGQEEARFGPFGDSVNLGAT